MNIGRLLAASTAVALVMVPAASFADTSDKRIALSNNYAGNSMRQAQLLNWDAVAQEAVAAGIVAAADAFTTAENSATEQAAQIQNLILQGYHAIAINPASPTALNGAIKEACDAGVIVVAYDGNVTEPCAWNITTEWKQLGRNAMQSVVDQLPEGGKVLEIRGLAGVDIDDLISGGVHEVVAENPQFTIVGTVHGDWAQEVAQRAVAGILPSLPEDIVAVVGQGGDGYGAAQAFLAAGRDLPLITFGNRYEELAFWKQLKDESGYESYSVCITPSVTRMAFWVAQQILDGADVPKTIVLPLVEITQETLEENLANTPQGGLTDVPYTQEDAKALIASIE